MLHLGAGVSADHDESQPFGVHLGLPGAGQATPIMRVNVLRYRYLFSQLVRRELRQKYKGSLLGVLWYFINPLVLMGAYTLLFGVILKTQPIKDYPIFLMV